MLVQVNYTMIDKQVEGSNLVTR